MNTRCFCSLALLLTGTFASLVILPLGAQAQASGPSKRPVTVENAIEMTRLANEDYFLGMDSKGRVAQFSPNGKFFVIVVRKGNLEKNTNDFTLFLYQVAEAFHSEKPDILVRMSSSSNRDAISHVRWLPDGETIVFLGENPGEMAQVYELSLRTRHVTKRTSSPMPITDYDCTPDGRTILFAADSPSRQFPGPTEEEIRRQGVIISDQPLQALLAGEYGHPNLGQQVFVQERGQPPISLSLPGDTFVTDQHALSLSPDGRHALIRAKLLARSLHASWLAYEAISSNEFYRLFFKYPIGQAYTPLTRLLLVDTKKPSVSALWDAPTLGTPSISWAENGASVFVPATFLPLDGISPEERALREHHIFDVEVSVVDGQYRKVSKDKSPKPVRPKEGLEVTMEEDVNNPPKIFAFDPDTKQKALLLDLNPQFNQLDLGNVETVDWVADGVHLIGGLYLPIDFTEGHRYPLVIQTHGFNPDRFSMDGLQEWSSGYAARPLAAKGFLVLQMLAFKDPDADHHYNDHKTFGVNNDEAGRKLNVRGIETAIDYLDGKGLIDRDRVGLAGFSRSVSFVAYLLTHSNKHFAAASLVDGIDAGYFQELAYPEFAWGKDPINGGSTPFGEGLKRWLQESPSFSLGNVRTPLRLLALGNGSSPLELWEWFAGLSLQKKPVEYVLLPNAAHLVVKPSERLVAQQGLVDWFRFWLKGEEDANTSKREQYGRWRALRGLVEENGGTALTN